MAILDSLTDLDIKGRILASIVPNSTGSVVTWNSSTNVFGLRTNAQIIADLGLQGGLTNGLHTLLNGNKIDVAFDVNTYVKDKSNNNRLLFGNTQPTDVVIKGAVANGNFTVEDSAGGVLFRVNGASKVPYFPQLPAPQTGTTDNLAVFDTGNGLWKHNIKISDLALSSQIPTNYITTNTNQTGLTGNKTTTGGYEFVTTGLNTPVKISNGAGNLSFGSSSGTNFLPGITSNSTNQKSGIYFTAQGFDNYHQGAFVLSGRNALGTGQVTSGDLFNIQNYTTSLFSVNYEGRVLANSLRVSNLAGVSDTIVLSGLSGDVYNSTFKPSDFALASSLANYVTTNTQQVVNAKKQWTAAQSYLRENNIRHIHNVANSVGTVASLGADNYFLVNLGSSLAAVMWEAEIEIYEYNQAIGINLPKTRVKRFLVTGYHNTATEISYNRSVTQISGDTDNIESVTFFRDASGKIVLGFKSTTAWSYPKVYLKRLSLHHSQTDAIENAVVANASVTYTNDVSALTSYYVVPNANIVKNVDTDWVNSNFHKLAKNAAEAQTANYYLSGSIDADTILGNVSFYPGTGSTNAIVNSHLISYGVNALYGWQFNKSAGNNQLNVRTRINGVYTAWDTVAYQSWVTQQITNAGGNYITTNTTQTGLSGDKVTAGKWTYNGAGNRTINAVNTSASISSNFGFVEIDNNSQNTNMTIGNAFLIKTNNLQGFRVNGFGDVYTERGFFATNGFSKIGQNDTQILLAGGGHRPVSDFALTGSLSNYVDLTTAQIVNGQKTFTASTTRWLMANNPVNAYGFVQSAGSGFYTGTLSDHNYEIYRNTVRKVTVTNNSVIFVDNVIIPNGTSNNHAVNKSQLDAVSASIPNAPNNGLLTISTSADLTGGGTFSADQATASNVAIGLSAGTLASLALANTAVQPSALSGYVPISRTLTINGTTLDLSQNRTWTIPVPAQVNITQGAGISVTGTYPNLTISNTAPNATHTGDVTGSTALTIANNAVTFPKMQNIATQTFLGRATAGTGNVESLTVAQMQTLLGFSTQTLSNSTSNLIVSNTVQRAALTGDVTAPQNSNATTIANGVVTNAKMANMAANTFKGRLSTAGAPQDLTVAQMQTALGVTAPNNGTFTVSGDGVDIVGTGSTSANASANTSSTLSLSTAIKGDITAGKNAGIQLAGLFSDAVQYFIYNDVSAGGSVDTNEAFFNLVNPTTVSGLTIDIVNHHINGARLVLQGVTGFGGIVTYTGKFIMRNHILLSTLVIEGQIDQEFVWDVNENRWREVF